MTLPRRLSAIFQTHKVNNFPFARDAIVLLHGERRRWVWRLVCGVGIGLLIGVIGGMYAQRPQLNSIQETTHAWYKDCVDRHPSGPKVMSKAQAQVIVSQKERRE